MADGSEQQPAVPVGRYRVRPLRKLAEGALVPAGGAACLPRHRF